MEGALEQFVDYLPRLLGAIALVVVAWLVAVAVRFLMRKGLQKARLDERMAHGQPPEERGPSLTKTLSEAAYWIVFLLFLPLILDTLALEGLLEPFGEMANGFLAFLPNLVGAALILLVGWFIAKIVQRVLANVLASAGVDRFSDKAGVSRALGERRLSGLIGLIAYVLILIPVAIAALNALELEAVTAPASEMLNDVLVAIPAVFGAAVILAIAFVVGKLVRGLVTQALTAVGFDRLFRRMGIESRRTDVAPSAHRTQVESTAVEARGEVTPSRTTPSYIVGYIAFIAIMLFATMAALRLLEFHAIEAMVAEFIEFGGQILMGLLIFAVGLWLGNWAADVVKGGDMEHSNLLAQLTRAGILILAGAMALRQMGLANEIITLAFAFLIGAIAVAAAIAFGIGGRDVAADVLSDWRRKVERDQVPPPTTP